MGLEKFNYAIDANIEKAERVFPDDYKIKDEEKDSYDELFDDWRKDICPEARSIGEKLNRSDIYEVSEEAKNAIMQLNKQLSEYEVYNYGSELNEKYSALDKEGYEKECDEEYKIDTAEELMDFIQELLS